ncbi:CdaR family transcriptional regulator [Streptomyces sp. VRA16 Mangrove soil]|uniref:PucR family transcriptional regulator n=1 Tax=Streptomyces sp. VRA16 Mangrove soil TaxID=2817434 RepID=UPI001A9DB944|nr:PucR family transcriptional regulator [Streptomyces sp. VRA16 Mangrove soil]MBO1330441.1 helix-turn-helix domain-containing protein [Streptomyces sp. VRA16 Mangrove soil]
MLEELQRVVEALAHRLGRAVAVDDLDFRLLAYSTHADEGDAWRARVILRREAPPEALAWLRRQRLGRATGPVRLPADNDLGILPRVAVPVVYQDVRFGYLWLFDAEGSLTEAQLELASAAAADAGAICFRERVVSHLRTAREGELVRDLLSDDAKVRGMASARLVEEGLFALRGDVTVVVARPLPADAASVDEDDRIALQAAVNTASARLGDRGRLRLVRPDHAVLVTPTAALRRSPELPAAIRAASLERLGRSAKWRDVHVATGSPAHRLHDAVTSYTQALDALRVAEVVPSFAPLVAHEALGIYALLAGQPIDQLGAHGVHPAVRRLLEADPQLFTTAELYLDRAGDARATADELGLHRASVYHRVRRIEEVTELDLSDGQHRLILHLGIKVSRLLGLV